MGIYMKCVTGRLHAYDRISKGMRMDLGIRNTGFMVVPYHISLKGSIDTDRVGMCAMQTAEWPLMASWCMVGFLKGQSDMHPP